MHHLQKTAFPEDIKSFRYINRSTTKSLYSKDADILSNWSSYSHEHRHRRHHHNHVMHQVKNSLSRNVKDANIASSMFSLQGNVSNHVSIQKDTNELKTFNSDQVG